MSVVTIVSGNFCDLEAVVGKVGQKTGYRRIDEEEIIALAANESGMDGTKIVQAFTAGQSIFNRFTHEKERSVAYLRLALAQLLAGGDCIVTGPAALLVPESISHILRVCLIADHKDRLRAAMDRERLRGQEAAGRIARHDEDLAAWVHTLERGDDPWARGLYDMVLPMGKTAPDAAADLIAGNAASDIVERTPRSEAAQADFLLAARVETALAAEGHHVGVSAEDGAVTLTINQNVLMLSRLSEELSAVAEKVSGVLRIDTAVGEGFHRTDLYRKFDLEMPSKVLLVDDEREFVQTLSERLIMRDMGAAVAYDGASALTMVRKEEPEVIVLDLKMPGIDGIEVLRRVKDTQPAIEVIVLTGHGSEMDRQLCLSLGAFAYLQKPVEIDILTETIRKANEKATVNR